MPKEKKTVEPVKMRELLECGVPSVTRLEDGIQK